MIVKSCRIARDSQVHKLPKLSVGWIERRKVRRVEVFAQLSTRRMISMECTVSNPSNERAAVGHGPRFVAQHQVARCMSAIFYY